MIGINIVTYWKNCVNFRCDNIFYQVINVFYFSPILEFNDVDLVKNLTQNLNTLNRKNFNFPLICDKNENKVL